MGVISARKFGAPLEFIGKDKKEIITTGLLNVKMHSRGGGYENNQSLFFTARNLFRRKPYAANARAKGLRARTNVCLCSAAGLPDG